MSKAVILSTLLLLILTSETLLAQDDIPTTSGFSGYVLFSLGYFNVETNLIAQGAPLLGDAGASQIESITAAPSSESVPALIFGGEINYTFASTRTQLFFGNRLEDVLRLDIAYGLGVRQELSGAGIVAASFLFTPLELKFWSDPYVEGEDRKKTGLNFPGLRFRWGRILKTGLEFTATAREYRIDEQMSGDWLINEGRLDPAKQPLLDREGNILRLQALYRFQTKKHRFEPAVRYIDDAHNGRAIANRGYSLQMTYLYLSPRIVLDANLVYGYRKADEVNPIYDELLETDRWGAAITAFIPIKLFNGSGWRFYGGAELFQGNANIDFYDSQITSISAGLMWAHKRE